MENPETNQLAVVFTGGGARAAYQVGVLRAITRRHPAVHFDIVTGVSAGAINALFLASHTGTVARAVDDLAALWEGLRLEDVITCGSLSVMRHLAGFALRLISGGRRMAPHIRGLLDTSPLRRTLVHALPANSAGEIIGIEENLSRCRPRAIALTTLDYNSGQTITWVDGCTMETWKRPLRRSVRTRLTIEHIMASSSLPILFPAVQLGSTWHGDGGIRLTAPLSPALHLGARRILTIASSHHRSFEEAQVLQATGYPPPAQILGQLMNAVFLDVIDEDAFRLERSNEFLADLPPKERHGFRVVDLLVIRPSEDLGAIAAEFEPRLPRDIRLLTRSLGTHETSRPDFLTLLMFQSDYLNRLIACGEADANRQMDEITRLLADD